MMASTTQCPSCSAAVPATAQFCPRCGKAVHPPTRERTAPDGPPAKDTTSPTTKTPPPVVNLAKAGPLIPLPGLLFLIGLVLGPAGIIAGLLWASPFLLYAGVALSVLVIVVLILGHFF